MDDERPFTESDATGHPTEFGDEVEPCVLRIAGSDPAVACSQAVVSGKLRAFKPACNARRRPLFGEPGRVLPFLTSQELFAKRWCAYRKHLQRQRDADRDSKVPPESS